MAAPVVAIDGLKALRRDLLKLGDADMPKAFVAAGVKVAEPLAARIASALPHDSGALADSVRVAKVRTGASLRVGSRAVPYGPVVEWGGYPGGRAYIPDGRYIFPAARAAGPEAVRRYADEVQKIIDRFDWSGPHD